MNVLSRVVEVTIIPLNFCRRERSPIPKDIGYVISSIQKSRVLRFYFFHLFARVNREDPENEDELQAPCNLAFRNIGSYNISSVFTV